MPLPGQGGDRAPRDIGWGRTWLRRAREGDGPVPLMAAALATVCFLAILLWRATVEGRGGAAGVSLCLVVRDQVDMLEGMLAQLLDLAGQWGACVVDVVLVDAGSRDGTADLVRALGRLHAGLKVLCWPDDAPDGSALDLAYRACEAPWVLIARATAPGDADRLCRVWLRRPSADPR